MAEDIFRLSQTYLMERVGKLAAERQFKRAAKPVKEWLDAKDGDGKFINGVMDDDGNRVFKFAKPVRATDGKLYSGVMLKRSQGPSYFDSEEVLDFMNGFEGKIRERVVKKVEVVEVDELYVLQQEGQITEDELRKLMHKPDPEYSLWPIEDKTIAEE